MKINYQIVIIHFHEEGFTISGLKESALEGHPSGSNNNSTIAAGLLFWSAE